MPSNLQVLAETAASALLEKDVALLRFVVCIFNYLKASILQHNKLTRILCVMNINKCINYYLAFSGPCTADDECVGDSSCNTASSECGMYIYL